jgi:hypothetical protein
VVPGFSLIRAGLAIPFAQRPNEGFPYWIHDTKLGPKWQGILAPSLIGPSVTLHPDHLKFSFPEEPNEFLTYFWLSFLSLESGLKTQMAVSP